jgi:hypothetical protein
MSCLTEHIMIDFISNLNWVYELILVITMTALTLKFSGVVYIFWHSPSAGEGRLFRIGSQICCLASPSSPLKSLRYLFILTIRKSRRRSWVSNNLHSWELSLGWLTLFLTDFMGMIFWRGFGPDILFNRLASLPLRFWLRPLFRINLIILCLSSLSFILYVACRLRLIRRIFVFLNISRLLGTVMQTFLHVIKVLVQVLVANRCFVIFQRSHWAIFPILVINFSFFSCKVSSFIRLLILIHRRAF